MALIIDTANEGSDSYVTLTFYDETGSPETPLTCTWQVHDLETDTELQAETGIVPANPYTLQIPGSVNQVVNADKELEFHRLTIKSTYGVGSEGYNDDYDFAVRNLRYV